MAEPRNYCDEALASVGIKPNSGEGFDNSTAKQPKHADILVGLATTGCELFHDPDDIAYADITISGHRETWPIVERVSRAGSRNASTTRPGAPRVRRRCRRRWP